MPTIFGGDTGKTQGDLSDQRKRLAYAMLQQGMDASPVQSPWQGAARLAQALMGGLEIRQADQQQRAATAEAPAVSTGAPSTPPAKAPGLLPSLFGVSKETAPGATGSSIPKTKLPGNFALPRIF
ncbi:hypothetical protein ELI20_04980 [Rhizobium ruizarguesonis]|nr:hypothetical protein ELI52_04955 [Rhizobium ruizarguesonis]TAU34174.1 hypothetical protein ELI47_04865 [Rhizobium ruizarguesonis]TAW24351.1 hypothetical protein ELI20_04980 [Rhizobium ruizarguesonis]